MEKNENNISKEVKKMKSIIYKNKKKVIIISIILIILILTLLKINISKKDESVVIKEDNELLKKEEKDNNLYYVDIKGAVANPGVYSIESNKRVIDAIKMAGGLLDNSDTTNINLSKYVTDEMVIVIYTKEELEQINNSIDYSFNDAYQDYNNSKNKSSDNNNLININSASLEELKTLPGIGDTKAKSIIDYRESNGKFNSIEDIQNVKGIGSSLYEKIKNNITV